MDRDPVFTRFIANAASASRRHRQIIYRSPWVPWKARRYYSKRTYQRVLKSLVQIDEQAVQKYLRAIADEEEKVNKIAQLVDAQYLREISKTMEGGFSSLLDRMGGVSQQIAELKLDLSKQKPPMEVEKEDMLKWLYATSTYEDYHTAKAASQHNTCNWILQRAEFRDWLDQDQSPRAAKVLWLHGKHGTGKTILSARIAQELHEDQTKLFAFFFCFYGNEQKRCCSSIVNSQPMEQLMYSSFSLATRPK